MSDVNFKKIKSYILLATIFLFPLFFLPITQEYFATNKMYLLAVSGFLLLITSLTEFAVTRKIVFEKKPYDIPIIFFIFSIILSILLISPNKIQAILDPTVGLLPLFGLGILLLYGSRFLEKRDVIVAFSISAMILGLIAIIFFFSPFKSAQLSFMFQYLKNPYFTPLGQILDLLFYFGFVLILAGFSLYQKRESKQEQLFHLTTFSVVGVGFALTLYEIVKALASGQSSIMMAPYRLSWYAALATLKHPLNALFGVGVNNFQAIFTNVKDAIYNTSSLWQVPSFALSHSGLLHIMTVAGLLGIVSFGLLLWVFAKQLSTHFVYIALFAYLCAVLMFFPLSLPMLFLLMVLGILMMKDHKEEPVSYDLKYILPVWIAMVVLFVAVLGYFMFTVSRYYLAEVYYKNSLDAIAAKNGTALYVDQQKAITTNPFIESYHLGFAQTNLTIAANMLATKKQLSDQQKQLVIQAVQTAIQESKNAVSLNPQNATYWENLARVYQNILPIAQGSDSWSVTAYQQAISLDPQNTTYAFELGGLFYSLNQYDNAAKAFEQSVVLKTDWANAHYNLAWAYYQLGRYQDGITQLQTVSNLTDPKKNKADYDKVQGDIEAFKKKLPAATTTTTPATTKTSATKQELTVPQSSPSAIISPKIKLPSDASPAATVTP